MGHRERGTRTAQPRPDRGVSVVFCGQSIRLAGGLTIVTGRYD